MLKEYLHMNIRRIMIKTILIFIFSFLCVIVSHKLFQYTVDYVSFYAGVLIMLCILELISYIKWLRANSS